MQRHIVSGLVICLFVGGGSRDHHPSAEPPAEYLIAGTTEGAPEGCDRETIALRLAAFMAAVNAGSRSTGETFFSDPEDAPFAWYSFADPVLNQVPTFTAGEIGDLAPHFSSRPYPGAHLALRGIDFIGWRADRGTVGLSPIFFDFVARDSLRDGATPVRGFGKAEYHCATSAFVVMGLATARSSTWDGLFRVHLAGADTLRIDG